MPIWTIRQYVEKYPMKPSTYNLTERDYVGVPYKDESNLHRAKFWCNANISKTHWYYLHDSFWFTTESHAAQFKEVWIENTADLPKS